MIPLENRQLIPRYALEPARTFFSDVDCCFQMASNDYFLFFVILCRADTPICRYSDRCSRLLAIAMTSNPLPEVVIGFADPPHPWRISKLSLKYWRDKHHLRQESMPVIPVNPNHPAASAARKQTPSTAVCKSPPQAAKMRANNALMHEASASAPRYHDVVSVAAAFVATDAGNAAGLADAHAVSVAAFAAAAGSLTLPAHSINSSNSSESDLDIIGGDRAASGRKSTGLSNFSDQLPMEDYFSVDGDVVDNDMDDNMPTDAEASKYSFLDNLEHYMEWAIVTEGNCKAVELAIMVEVGTTVREMDPMKKEAKEKAFLHSYVSIIEKILDKHLKMQLLDQQ